MITVFVFASGTITIPSLEVLFNHQDIDLIGIASQQDRIHRSKLIPTKVSKWALGKNIKLYKEKSVNNDEFISELKTKSIDIILVFDFGQILSNKIVNNFLCINIHTSLLPKYRGASPITSALLNGDKQTGISIIKITESLDKGDIYFLFKIDIEEDDYYLDLEHKLANLSAQKIVLSLKKIFNNQVKPKPQIGISSFCKKVKKDDALINWDDDSQKILNKIRAFHIWPKAYSFIKIDKSKKRFIINKARVFKQDTKDYKKFLISCGSNTFLEVISITIEGGNTTNGIDFINGHKNIEILGKE